MTIGANVPVIERQNIRIGTKHPLSEGTGTAMLYELKSSGVHLEEKG